MGIGSSSFKNCSSLAAIDLSNVTAIGQEAFAGCRTLKATDKATATDEDKGIIVFSDNLSTIGSSAFEGCTSIKEVTIPGNVTEIDWYAFKNTGLETVYFNATSCSCGSKATFSDNSSLTKFVFGEKVTQIPGYICYDVTNLQSVEFNGKVMGIGSSSFKNCSSLADVYYNAGSEDDWKKIEINTGNDILSSNDVTIHFGILTYNSDNSFDVTVSCDSKTFSQEVKLSVSNIAGERQPGSVYISDNEIREQIGCFNIKMILADGSSTDAVQPNGTVTVKMAIPENYIGKPNFKIVHRLDNEGKTRETFSTTPKTGEKKLSVSSDGKYWIFDVTSFSEFEFFTIEAAPTVSIKNNPGSATINYGETLNLTAVTTNMPADAKIVWYVDGVKKGEGTTFNIAPESGSVNVTVKIVDKDGNNYAGIEISDSKSFTVNAAPTVSIKNNPGSATINYGETLNLTAVTTNMPADAKIVWYVDGVKKGEGTTFNIAPESGSVNVTVKIVDKDGNNYAGIEISDSKSFTVNAAPTVSIKNNPGSATINYGETLNLTAVTTNMPADAKIVWYVDGVKKGEGTTFNIAPESGSVNVTVKIVDKDGNESYGTSVSDSQTVTVKSGFFQKLISFFKNLFGLNRVIVQSLNLK